MIPFQMLAYLIPKEEFLEPTNKQEAPPISGMDDHDGISINFEA